MDAPHRGTIELNGRQHRTSKREGRSLRGLVRRIAGTECAIAAAVAAMGIVMTSSGAVRREAESGSLVRVLEHWDLGSLDLSAVFVSGKAAKRAARAFTDYLIAVLRDA